MADLHGWDKERQESVVHELATQFGLQVTPALHEFYAAAYATAVYDIADEVPLDMSRETVIELFAPPKAQG